jgi:hypothetical protein
VVVSRLGEESGGDLVAGVAQPLTQPLFPLFTDDDAIAEVLIQEYVVAVVGEPSVQPPASSRSFWYG